MTAPTWEAQMDALSRQIRLGFADEREQLALQARSERDNAMRHLWGLLGDWCASYGWPPVEWARLKREALIAADANTVLADAVIRADRIMAGTISASRITLTGRNY